MKQFLLLLILFLMSGCFLAAQSSQAVFDEANTYYEEGEVSQAMSMYRMLENAEFVSGALYLNMGIIASQLDSMGLAKYYFLKSAEFEETEDRANSALEYVSSQFSRQSATLPQLPWDRAVEWMNEGPTAFGVFITGIVIGCIGLIFLYLKWFKFLKTKNIRWVISSCLTTGALIILLSFYIDYVDQRYHEAVLVENSKRVLQSPDEQGNLVSIAYEGYSVIVDQWKSNDHNNWLYIRLGNGQYGWVEQEGIRIL